MSTIDPEERWIEEKPWKKKKTQAEPEESEGGQIIEGGVMMATRKNEAVIPT